MSECEDEDSDVIAKTIVDKSNILNSNNSKILKHMLLKQLILDCDIKSTEDKEYIEYWLDVGLDTWLCDSVANTYDFICQDYESHKRSKSK